MGDTSYRLASLATDRGNAQVGGCPEPLVELLLELLALHPDDLVVDLGLGFPGCLPAVLERAALRYQVIVVDDGTPGRRRPVPCGPAERPIEMGLLEFVAYPFHYDKVLLGAELGPDVDGPLLFERLFDQLCTGGRLVLVQPPAGDSRAHVGLGAPRSNGTCPAAALERVGFSVSRHQADCGSQQFDLLLGRKGSRQRA